MNFEELVVPFKLNSSQFDNKLDDMVDNVNNKTNSLTTKLTAFAKGFATIAAGLVAAGLGAVGAGLTYSIDQTLTWGSTLDDLGDALGTTSEESSALALAAQRVGLDVDSLASGMQILTRNTTNLDGSLTDTGLYLQSLGIEVLDANGNFRDSSTIIQEVSDVIASLPEGLDRSNVLMNVFGRSGADLNDVLLELAGSGMEDYTTQAEAMGLALSGDQTQNVIDFKKEIEKLKQILQGLGITVGTELLPIITPLIENFSTWAIDNLPAVKETLKNIIDFIKTDVLPKLEAFSNWFSQTGLPAIQNFIDGTTEISWDSITTWIQEGGDTILNKFNDWINSQSSNQFFRDLGNKAGDYIVDGIVYALENGDGEVIEAVFRFIGRIDDIMMDRVLSMGANFVTGLFESILEHLGLDSEWVQIIGDALAHQLSDIAHLALSLASFDFAEVGKSLMDILWGNMGVLTENTSKNSKVINNSKSGATTNGSKGTINNTTNNYGGFDEDRLGIVITNAVQSAVGAR